MKQVKNQKPSCKYEYMKHKSLPMVTADYLSCLRKTNLSHKLKEREVLRQATKTNIHNKTNKAETVGM